MKPPLKPILFAFKSKHTPEIKKAMKRAAVFLTYKHINLSFAVTLETLKRLSEDDSIKSNGVIAVNCYGMPATIYPTNEDCLRAQWASGGKTRTIAVIAR